MLKKILLFLLLVFVVIQFIHPARNKSKEASPNYVGNRFAIPDDVKHILQKACNDCHSNNTVYPWYSYIQPVDWWLTKHVNDGKKELNFDEYTNRSLRYQYHKMEEIEEVMNEKSMPLDSYTWIHREAKLSSSEKQSLVNWAASIRKQLESTYPMDSLVRRN